MRTTLILATLSVAMIGAGASAQTRYAPPPPTDRLPGISASADTTPTYRDTSEIRRDIRRGRTGGTLSKREARGLRREAGQIDTLADRYAADGLSDSERRELDTRSRVLRDLTNAQRTAGSARPR